MTDFFRLIEEIRKYKTENKLKLSEEITTLTVSATKDQISNLEKIQDDIRGVARAEAILFETGVFGIRVER